MKDAIKEKLDQKTVLIAFVALAVIGGGTATVLDVFAQSEGTVDVDQAVQSSSSNLQFTASTTGQVLHNSGDTLQLTNNRDIGTRVNYVDEYAEASSISDSDYQDEVEGLVSETMVYKQRNASNYDVVVDSSSDLENAISNSTTKVLVEDGSYTVDTDVGVGGSELVLDSKNGATETTIDFDDGQIEANGEDFTVRGFNFTGKAASTEGVIFHTTANNDISGSLTVEKNIFDTEEPYRDVWTQDTETVTFRDNFFYGENTDAAIDVNLDDSVATDGNLYIDSNTFVSYPTGQKAIALRTVDSSTADLEITDNNFVYLGNAVQYNDMSDEAALTDATGNYFGTDGDGSTKIADSTFSIDFKENASEPNGVGVFELNAETTYNTGLVGYTAESADASNNFGFRLMVQPAP